MIAPPHVGELVQQQGSDLFALQTINELDRQNQPRRSADCPDHRRDDARHQPDARARRQTKLPGELVGLLSQLHGCRLSVP